MTQGFLQSFNNFGYGESLEEKVRGEKQQDFPLKVSCLTVPECFVGQPFRVSLVSGIKTFYVSEGCVTSFCLEIFVSQYRNILQGNPSVLCFRKLPAAIKFMHRRRGDGVGSIKAFCQKFFISQCRKKSRGSLLRCVSEIFRQQKSLWIRRGESRFSVEIFFFSQFRKNQ